LNAQVSLNVMLRNNILERPQLDRPPRDWLQRLLSLNAATLLVVSSVVGSGIFFTPGEVAELVPHPGLILTVWILGGLLSLAGALANAELGAMFPHAGRDYVYLREAYHCAAGFLVRWLTFFVIYAGTIATLAASFAAGLAPLLGYGTMGRLGVAIAIIIAVSTFNYVNLRWAALANSITAYLKIGALLALGLVVPLLSHGHGANLELLIEGASVPSFWDLGAALSPVLFSYLGWNASIYVASEIRDPARNIPRSLFLGLAICILVYLVINGVYLYTLPMEELCGVENAGEVTARAVFGSLGKTFVTILVLASIFGTLNAMILVGPRIAYAMALDGLFFRGVEAEYHRFHTPHISIATQCAVSVALLVGLRSFPHSLFSSAVSYATFAIVLATVADTSALYVLRWRQPERPRPYRAWGYPWLPALYLVANGAIAIALLVERPGECMAGLAIAATGLPFYWLFSRGGRRAISHRGGEH
jgi:APA family basic amino acid/polyamine antiporter